MMRVLMFILLIVSLGAISEEADTVTQKALAGEAQAQFDLGWRYLEGKGVEKSTKVAKEWFIASAKQGYIPALFMAALHEDNPFNRTKMFKSAAEGGHIAAMYFLGIEYLEGKSIKQDYVESVKWLRLSAENGYLQAQAMLGAIYFNGVVVKQDYFEAFKWRKLAAEQQDPNSQVVLGMLYSGGLGVRQSFENAKYWFGIACDNQSELGCKKYAELNVSESRQ